MSELRLPQGKVDGSSSRGSRKAIPAVIVEASQDPHELLGDFRKREQQRIHRWVGVCTWAIYTERNWAGLGPLRRHVSRRVAPHMFLHAGCYSAGLTATIHYGLCAD
jgi:hypothetical protein